MKERINLVKNICYSSISTFTNLFLFVLIVFIGRYLGVEKLGVFTFSMAFVAIFEILIDLGIRELGVRNVARDLELTDKYACNLFVWQFFLMVITFIFLMCTVNLLGYNTELKKIIYLLGVSTFIRRIKFTFRLFFQAHNRFDLDTLLVVVEKSALLLVCLAVLIKWQDILILAVAFFTVRIFDIILTFIILNWKITRIKLQFDLEFIKKLQLDALPRGIYIIILVLLSYIDTIMLKEMTNYKEVGLYNAAYKIYEGINIIPIVFYMVVLPRLSQLFTFDLNAYNDLAKKVVKYMFVISLFIVVYGLVFSERMIDLLYKIDFARSAITLKILIIGSIFHFTIWMLHTILVSSDRQKIIMINGFIGLTANVIFNLIAIPKYGSNGAAAATVFSELILFACAWIYLNKHDIKLSLSKLGGRPILAAVVVFFTLHFLSSIPLIPLVVCGGIVYGIILLIFNTFDKKELNSFYQQAVAIVKIFTK